ncbi:uncharacterized protein EAE97_009795 [Botrytis byssoidea]|uniref:Uncharacterized protein n=1 Tax=Botrytis byssoidea TaxID=139641 RepID=A0A9P5I4A4_9HELO|nr:uncharacterized protein EAE97_009795 [Botrytis byssoidea]KAF7928953.1 hypothetical protein EAE97_009795 [Botrytis byssoidea]
MEPNVAESLEKKYKPEDRNLVDIARKIRNAKGEVSFKDSEYVSWNNTEPVIIRGSEILKIVIRGRIAIHLE